jgi:hypothetical protein
MTTGLDRCAIFLRFSPAASRSSSSRGSQGYPRPKATTDDSRRRGRGVRVASPGGRWGRPSRTTTSELRAPGRARPGADTHLLPAFAAECSAATPRRRRRRRRAANRTSTMNPVLRSMALAEAPASPFASRAPVTAAPRPLLLAIGSPPPLFQPTAAANSRSRPPFLSPFPFAVALRCAAPRRAAPRRAAQRCCACPQAPQHSAPRERGAARPRAFILWDGPHLTRSRETQARTRGARRDARIAARSVKREGSSSLQSTPQKSTLQKSTSHAAATLSSRSMVFHGRFSTFYTFSTVPITS